MLRGLIVIIPGKPTVIANCHPAKNAIRIISFPQVVATFSIRLTAI